MPVASSYFLWFYSYRNGVPENYVTQDYKVLVLRMYFKGEGQDLSGNYLCSVLCLITAHNSPVTLAVAIVM
jgi:hypothetical protein